MPGTMIEERRVGPILEKSRQRTAQQSEFDQPLSHHAYRGLVRLIPVIAGTHLLDGGQLRLEHHFVDGPLRRAELTADREGPCYVRSVVIVFATRIEQQELAVAQWLVVVAVMHHTGIGAAAHDRVVGHVGIVGAKLMQNFRHDFVFHAPRGCKAHRTPMCPCRDLRGAPQARLFGTALIQTHVVQHVRQGQEFVHAAAGLARVRAQSVDPADDARIEVWVAAHGIENPRT